MRLPPASALARHPIGRHVLIYGLGAAVVRTVSNVRQVLEGAHLLSPTLCADCAEKRAAVLNADGLTPTPEGDRTTDSPAYTEDHQDDAEPAAGFGVNGAGDVEQLVDPVVEQSPAE